jgi:phenylpyruvate tautomerase PptA (4-oxalocrotonate tautomerase family)
MVLISFWFMLDVNILGGNIRTMRKNTKALVAAITEVRLEVYADETKYVVTS